MAASMECLQAPLRTPSSPDRSRLAPLALDHTRLSRPKPNREPVRRLLRERYSREKFGGGVRPASQNPYPIYEQNLRFSLTQNPIPHLRPNP